MNASSHLKFFAFLCLVCFGSAVFTPLSAKSVNNTDASPAAQIQFASIVVNGRTLNGPNSSAQRRDGRILIPVMAIARVLGDAVSMDAATRVVTVRRQTGVSSAFDARLGQIRENGTSSPKISNSGEIIFTPNADEFLLPSEITAALFDVAIRYDGDKNAVIITRGQTRSDIGQSKNTSGIADIYQINYEYDLNRYSSAASHGLVLTAAGRLADGRFNFSSNSSNSPQHGMVTQSVTDQGK